jgi:hypothetical protein
MRGSRSRERAAHLRADRYSVGRPSARAAPLRRRGRSFGPSPWEEAPGSGGPGAEGAPLERTQAQESYAPAERLNRARWSGGFPGGARP